MQQFIIIYTTGLKTNRGRKFNMYFGTIIYVEEKLQCTVLQNKQCCLKRQFNESDQWLIRGSPIGSMYKILWDCLQNFALNTVDKTQLLNRVFYCTSIYNKLFISKEKLQQKKKRVGNSLFCSFALRSFQKSDKSFLLATRAKRADRSFHFFEHRRNSSFFVKK